MKLSIKEILDKIEKLNWYEIPDFITSLDLTSKQIDVLADHENKWVRWEIAENPKITDDIMIKLASDKNNFVRYGLAKNTKITEKIMIKLVSDEDWDVSYNAFKKLKKLNSLKKEELEEAYDLINNSKHISRENFEETFDYIIDKFPELSELAKMFKRIILKGKKDLK